MTRISGGLILVLSMLSAGCVDQNENRHSQGQGGQGSGMTEKQASPEQIAEKLKFDSWLEAQKANVLDREVVSDGEIITSKSGDFVIESQTRICGLPSEIDPRMNDLVPEGDWGEAAASFDGVVIAELLNDLNLDLNINGSLRTVTVPTSYCENINAESIYYFTVARPNLEGRPYRFDLMVWQKRGPEWAFWSGSIARPYMPTWRGRPLKSDIYEANWAGRGRVDRDGNLPDGTPFWSIGTDGTEITRLFVAEFGTGIK